MCVMSSMSADERRVGRKNGDDDIHIQLRGGFGNSGDAAEDLIPDTRWVKLDDLVEAMEKRELKKLFTFAQQLKGMLEVAG